MMRSVLRERERKSRERRSAQLTLMRTTVEALECVVPVLHTLDSGNDDDESLWGVLLDSDAQRLRKHLRRTLVLAQEAKQLQRDRVELKRLLHEHRLASYAIAGLHATRPTDDWEESIQQWRAITHRYFVPWTLDECLVEMEATLREWNAFLWSQDTISSGVSFLGWRDRRRIVHSRGAFQFGFRKTFHGHDVTKYLDLVWRTYTDLDTYNQVLVGRHSRGWVEVLQKLSPEIWIVRCVERYPAISMDAHMIYLVFRVKTDTGYTQGVRSLCMPKIQKKTCQNTDMLASNTVWLQWDVLNDAGTEYTFHIGGSLAGQDPNYAARWLVEGLAAVVRGERVATRRDLLTNLKF